jgi:hypothetical protein
LLAFPAQVKELSLEYLEISLDQVILEIHLILLESIFRDFINAAQKSGDSMTSKSHHYVLRGPMVH